MESNMDLIKDIYQREISLFRELLHCIAMERENLISLDLKALWSIMEEKQKILDAIEETKQEREGIAGENNAVQNDLPLTVKQTIAQYSKKLVTLKQEIKTRVNENISFINESLGFFNELFSAFVSVGKPEVPYGPMGKGRSAHPSLIYRNEV